MWWGSESSRPRSSAGMGAGIFPSLHLLRHSVALRRPVQRVFFYRFPHSTCHFMESVFPTLKSALSVTLRDFCPLAGKVRLAPGSQSQYELHYAEGDCVPFVIAEHDGDFDDLSGCHPREYTRVRSLAPEMPEPTDDGQRPVMSLQVILFPNKGLALAVAVHHSACDGSSCPRFVSSWACRASELEKAAPAPPSFDRSSVPDPNDAYSKFFSGLTADARNLESVRVQFAPPDAVIGTYGHPHRRRPREAEGDDLLRSEERFFPLLQHRGDVRLRVGFPHQGASAERGDHRPLSVPRKLQGTAAAGATGGVLRQLHRRQLRRGEGRRSCGRRWSSGGSSNHLRSHRTVQGRAAEGRRQVVGEVPRDRDASAADRCGVSGVPSLRRGLRVGKAGEGGHAVDHVAGRHLCGGEQRRERRSGEVAPKTEMDQFAAQFSRGLKLLHIF